MIRSMLWHKFPSVPLVEALPSFSWKVENGFSRASQTAALMLYVALNFSAETWTDENGQFNSVAASTYDDLALATGLSRSLICSGLERLQFSELIFSQGSHQKRRYKIFWPAKHAFFKLPCATIIHAGVIKPFQSFTMRSRHELHAMKLHLYFAAIRDNHEFYSKASYETIYERTDIPERHIRKSISLMLVNGTLQNVDNSYDRTTGQNEPNRYYLTGYPALVRSNVQPTSLPTAELTPEPEPSYSDVPF